MKSKFTSFIPRAAMTLLVMLLTTATAWAETIDGVKYIGAYGGEQTANGVTVLTGSETTLSAGWYVAQGTINYDHAINSTGTVHLILADGCKMTVEPSDANAQCAINIYNFTIYAQSNGGDAGSLTAIVNNSKAVTTCAITAYDKITINGGNITARSTNTSNGNLVDHSGIAGSSGLTINGGNIVATSESTVRGCGLSGKITINWNNKKEYMKPTMRTVELKHRTRILAGSADAYGMNKSLQNEEVTEGW